MITMKPSTNKMCVDEKSIGTVAIRRILDRKIDTDRPLRIHNYSTSLPKYWRKGKQASERYVFGDLMS